MRTKLNISVLSNSELFAKAFCKTAGHIKLLGFRTVICSFFLFSGFASKCFADIIIDNGNLGTSFTGKWQVSDGTNPYGANSLSGRNGDTYTWKFESQPAGKYEVLMWWSQITSAASSIEVDISYYNSRNTITINQNLNAGKWNSLGTYYFNSNGSVTIIAPMGAKIFTCADAVWFQLISLNTPPISYIDSIMPNPAIVGQAITFTGHGTDSDGNVAAYSWTSSINGNLSTQASFSTSSLSQGQHLITFEVQDNQGIWSTPVSQNLAVNAVNIPPTAAIDSITPNPAIVGQAITFTGHGTDSDGNVAAYSWTSNINGNLSTQASFSTSSLSQGQHLITFEVQDNQGIWSTPVSQNLVVTDNTVPSDIIIDNRDAATSKIGTWQISGATGFYGADSVWSRDGATFSWNFTPPRSGKYDLSMWWTQWSSRSSSIPVDIQNSDGTTKVYINQIQNGGKWNSLGQYTFVARNLYKITITSQPNPTSTCADAVKLTFINIVNIPPTAAIDSISPNPAIVGQAITFTGHGTDSDGNVAAYSWTSNINGNLSTQASFSTSSLSQGQHLITFEVQDNQGIWSTPVSQNLVVTDNTVPSDIIIDNRDAATSKIGTWQISGATGFYGADSVWSRDGATFSWNFTPPRSGKYDLSMWWTQWSSRSSSIPVDIQNSDGTTKVYINQIQNGGKWNSLGQYTFVARNLYKITITSQPNPTSTCADAVKLTFINIVNIPPTAAIDSISPNPAIVGQAITFTGHGTDSDGNVAAYSWTSNINGNLSTQASFSTSSLSQGQHLITFEVQDNQGIWSTPVSQNLVVTDNTVPSDIIIDNRDAATSKIGTWQISGATGFYGADSVWSRDGATFSWNFTPPRSGKYDLSMWWTQWSSRSSSIPVDIQNAYGTTKVYINQIQNGGKWNSLGQYTFLASNLYKITITSQPDPTSTCADAVKLTFISTVNTPPTAVIDSMTPNPADPCQAVTFNGHGTGGNGTITGFQWRSSIDGFLSDSNSFTTSMLSFGTHTIFFKVQNNNGLWSPEVSANMDVGIENIYIALPYNPDNARPQYISMLQSLGAFQEGNIWVYINAALNRTFRIHWADSIDTLKQALKTDGSHIIIEAHSNYGLGPVFATLTEISSQTVRNVYYIDDDRVFSVSSPWVAIDVRDFILVQAFPDWWPVFKDGTSGIMPYTFGDPRGNPPYNYYVTYQVPGDPTYYKIESANNSALKRFPDSGKPAWYAADGSTPNPANPNHLQYFITNTASWSQYYPKPHYLAKTIIFRKDPAIMPDQLKYNRIMYNSCNSAYYYTTFFNRGIMFYTLDTESTGNNSVVYLRNYLQGKTDNEIWQVLQNIQPVYDYYDFTKLPPTMQMQAIAAMAEPVAVKPEPVQIDSTSIEKINELTGLSLNDTFEKLKDVNFFGDDLLICKAISTHLAKRKDKAIIKAINLIELPVTEITDGKVIVNRTKDFYVAKKILKTFAAQSADKLVSLYQNGDDIARGNVIRLAGDLADVNSIRLMLMEALDDITVCQQSTSETIGQPLRLCDIAYNQLVLHYKIKEVLRTIGTGLAIEDRNYHINILKQKLQSKSNSDNF